MYTGSLRGVHLFWSVSLRRCRDHANRCHAIRQSSPGTERCKSPIAEWLVEISCTGTRKAQAAKHICLFAVIQIIRCGAPSALQGCCCCCNTPGLTILFTHQSYTLLQALSLSYHGKIIENRIPVLLRILVVPFDVPCKVIAEKPQRLFQPRYRVLVPHVAADQFFYVC